MIKELFEKGFKIESSAKSMKDMLDIFNATHELDSFKGLKILQDDVPLKYDSFLLHVNADLKDLGGIDKIVEGVIADKEDFRSKKDLEKLSEAAKMDRGTRRIDQKKRTFVDMTLFKQIPNIEFNEFDYKFFENFMNVKGGMVYKDSNGKVHRLFINKNNGIDLKGEIFSSNDDSLYTEMKKDIYIKYETYCKLANTGWARMDEDDKLEEIFINGFEYENNRFVIPTVMRHFIHPRAVYCTVMSKGKYGDEKPITVFEGFEAISNQGSMLFDDQLVILSQNWTKMTKGLIKSSSNWKQFSNTDEWAMNKYPIPKNWENAELPECWKNFFKGKAPKRILLRVFFYVGACLDAENEAQQALIIADNGGTGKGEFVRLLQDMLGRDMIGSFTDESLTNSRFSVFSHGMYKHHILVNTEYDGKSCNTELFKQLIGGDTISCEIKGAESFEFDARGLKMILSSNRICYMKEHAIRRRLIPVSFKTNFDISRGLPEREKIELRQHKDEFLAYCFKVYKQCPFRKNTGEYIVMNPKQEEEFLKTKKIPEDYERFLMKAFSEDPDIGDKFRCGDFTEETHLNDDFEEIYEELFEYSDNDNDVIPVTEFKQKILDFIFSDDDHISEFIDTFDLENISPESSMPNWIFANMKNRQNSQFIAYLEKTRGHVYGARKHINGSYVRVVTNIKCK